MTGDHGGGNGDESRQNDQERKEHFGDGGDEGDAASGFLRVGGHGGLDDEEVGTPVAEGKDEAEAGGEAEPVDAQGVSMRAGHAVPGVEIRGGQGVFEAVPSAYIFKPYPDQRSEAGDDEEELEDFVIDGAGKAAEEDVEQDDEGREEDGEVEDPVQRQAESAEEPIEDVESLDEAGHRVHGNAGGKHGHEGEGAGVPGAGFFVEAETEEFRDGAGFGSVVEGHHEDAHETPWRGWRRSSRTGS